MFVFRAIIPQGEKQQSHTSPKSASSLLLPLRTARAAPAPGILSLASEGEISLQGAQVVFPTPLQIQGLETKWQVRLREVFYEVPLVSTVLELSALWGNKCFHPRERTSHFQMPDRH